MDAREAFDDVLGGSVQDSISDMVARTLQALKRRRVRVPPSRVKVIGSAIGVSTAWSFEPPAKYVLGDDLGPVSKGAFKLFDGIHNFFRAVVGKPKLVRVDDEETYKDFRNSRRESYMDELEERLREIQRECDEQDFEEEMRKAIAIAMNGGKAVALDLPPQFDRLVTCWVDGDELLVSAKMPVGIVTTGVTLDDHFEDVVGCAEAIGCEGQEALMIGSHLAPKSAGYQLLGEIARTFSRMPRKKPFTALMTPRVDSRTVAMMGLLQRAQQGNRRAIREVYKIADVSPDFVAGAGEMLVRAQRRKAQVLGMSGKEFGVNFFGGAHTGGNILLHAFGAGELGDQLTELEKPALPGWAGGTADLPPPPQPAPVAAPAQNNKVVIVSAPNAVAVVHNNDTTDVVQKPSVVGIRGGTRFTKDGRVGYSSPDSVTVKVSTGKKVTSNDVKVVVFQGGKEQAL